MTLSFEQRLRFALRYALRHALISLLVAGLSALFVFALLYPPPYDALLSIGSIFLLLLSVDVVCGPLLTLLLASPIKPLRERYLDFSLVGLVQLAALFYGLHSVWMARPAVLAFETDRLVIVTANEVETEMLPFAPAGLNQLPWWGLLKVSTRGAKNDQEFLTSINLGLSGISPAMRPAWWLPWRDGRVGMGKRAKPVIELLERRPQDALTLQAAIVATGLPAQELRYLPLTSRRTKDWVALLDTDMRMVGHAPVDGFSGHD